MFTGIVEGTGEVDRVRRTGKGIELTIRPNRCAHGLKPGDSLAVNGCCLTVVAISRRGPSRAARFDLLQETWERTNLQFVHPGSLVNLERPLRADGQLGGHFVTGHIDGVGRITRCARSGSDWVLDIDAPPEVMRYVIFKGSIAVDGISLTIAAARKKGFRIWIIPHTWEVTNLRQRQAGEAVNLEADLVGKYVEQMLRQIKLDRRK
jgi:riboflavin synthase